MSGNKTTVIKEQASHDIKVASVACPVMRCDITNMQCTCPITCHVQKLHWTY